MSAIAAAELRNLLGDPQLGVHGHIRLISDARSAALMAADAIASAPGLTALGHDHESMGRLIRITEVAVPTYSVIIGPTLARTVPRHVSSSTPRRSAWSKTVR